MEVAYQVWSETFCDVPIIGDVTPSKEKPDGKEVVITKKEAIAEDKTVLNENKSTGSEGEPPSDQSFHAPSFGDDNLTLNPEDKVECGARPTSLGSPDIIKPFSLGLNGTKEFHSEQVEKLLARGHGKKVESVANFSQTTPPLVSPRQSQSSTSGVNGYSPGDVDRSSSYHHDSSIPHGQPLLINTNTSGIDHSSFAEPPLLNAGPHSTGQSLLSSGEQRLPYTANSDPGTLNNNNNLAAESPLSVRCTTQATVALLSKPVAENTHPYNTNPNYAPHPNSVIPQSRFVLPGYTDRPQFSYPPQRYHPYSPLPGSVPYHSNGYQPQYYQGYTDNPNYGFVNPQFPPQNYIDIPDIIHSNSVYSHYPGNHPSNGYHMMGEREPVLTGINDVSGNQVSYEEPMGVQGAGIGPIARESDSEDGPRSTKVPNSNAARKKRNASPGKDDTGKPKKTKSPKKRKKKDPNEPQKPVSAYAMFFRDTQASIKCSNPSATFGEVSKIVASMWDSLDEESKSDYKRRTEVAKKEYLQKLAAYRASLVSTGGLDTNHMSSSSASDSSPRESPERLSNQSELPTQMALSSHQSPPRVDAQSAMYEEQSVGLQQQSQYVREVMPLQPPAPEVAQPTATGTSPPSTADNDMVQNGVAGSSHELSGQEAVARQEEGSPGNDSAIPSNVFYGKSHPQTMVTMDTKQCVRDGCANRSVSSPQWDNEYCSNQCVVDHCRDVFTAWVASRSGYTSVN